VLPKFEHETNSNRKKKNADDQEGVHDHICRFDKDCFIKVLDCSIRHKAPFEVEIPQNPKTPKPHSRKARFFKRIYAIENSLNLDATSIS